MKKWIVCVLIGFFAAGGASAALWPFGSKDEPKEQPVVEQPRESRPGPGMQQRKSPQDSAEQRKGPQLSEEQRAAMRANRDAIQKLADAARNESDPAKKALLVDQLRAKLTEGAEKMQVEFRKRLEKAEGEVSKMKERLADAENNIDQKVEEQLQRILSGEKPERPEGKRTEGKRPEGKRPSGSPHKKPAPAVE